MKKFVLVGFLLLALAVMVPSVMAGGGPKDPSQPKTGMFDEKCGIYVGEEFGMAVEADAYWAYYAANDTHFLKCVGKLADGVTPPAEKIEFRGVLCFTHAGPTWNSKTVIEPDGEVRLTCKVSP